MHEGDVSLYFQIFCFYKFLKHYSYFYASTEVLPSWLVIPSGTNFTSAEVSPYLLQSCTKTVLILLHQMRLSTKFCNCNFYKREAKYTRETFKLIDQKINLQRQVKVYEDTKGKLETQVKGLEATKEK